MTITVKEAVTDALEEINYLAAEEPIEPADGQTAIRYLNDMMSMWDALGVSLGYTRVSNMGDTLTIADGALYGVKKLLAISLAPKFRSTISADLREEAKRGWEAILELAISITPSPYPSILPMGSGNYCGPYSGVYYPDYDEAIYTETAGFIATEEGTE
jgi:hypothetical protein